MNQLAKDDLAHRQGPWIQTWNNKIFHFLTPSPLSINLGDIAHALSHTCRFGGHTKTFYSVAQHSVLVSQNLEPRFARWGLMHDAAEAYVGDMPAPLKSLLPEFQAIETNILALIATRYHLAAPIPEEVKEMDLRLLMTERRDLMHDSPDGYPWDIDIEEVKPLEARIEPWESVAAAVRFIDQFNKVFGQEKYAVEKE